MLSGTSVTPSPPQPTRYSRIKHLCQSVHRPRRYHSRYAPCGRIVGSSASLDSDRPGRGRALRASHEPMKNTPDAIMLQGAYPWAVSRAPDCSGSLRPCLSNVVEHLTTAGTIPVNVSHMQDELLDSLATLRLLQRRGRCG